MDWSQPHSCIGIWCSRDGRRGLVGGASTAAATRSDYSIHIIDNRDRFVEDKSRIIDGEHHGVCVG